VSKMARMISRQAQDIHEENWKEIQNLIFK
jgi:hypothetical protein